MLILIHPMTNNRCLLIDSVGRIQISAFLDLQKPDFKFLPSVSLKPLVQIEQAIYISESSIIITKSASKLFIYKLENKIDSQNFRVVLLNQQVIHFTPNVDIQILQNSKSMIYSSCDYICNQACFVKSSKKKF